MQPRIQLHVPDEDTTLLKELLDQGGTLVLHHELAGEDYSLSGRLGGVTLTATATTVTGMLLAALGRGPRQRCVSCKRLKPLAMFTRDRSRPSGHEPRCLDCNRARLLPVMKKRRAA